MIFEEQAFSWEGESAAIHVITWFVDHRNDAPHCSLGRQVILHEDVGTWEQRLRSAWLDQIDQTQHFELHVVSPQPPQLEANIAAHVILVQAPRLSWVTSLVSIFDLARFGSMPYRLAVTTHERIYLEHLLMTCDYALTCLQPHSDVRCQAWLDRFVFQPNVPILWHSGASIVVQIHRSIPETIHHDIPKFQPLSTSDCPRSILCLEQCLSISDDRSLIPLRLVDGAIPPQLPDHIMLEDPISASEAESELRLLGYDRYVYLLGNTGFAFCIPINWTRCVLSRPLSIFHLNCKKILTLCCTVPVALSMSRRIWQYSIRLDFVGLSSFSANLCVRVFL